MSNFKKFPGGGKPDPRPPLPHSMPHSGVHALGLLKFYFGLLKKNKGKTLHCMYYFLKVSIFWK